MRFRQLLPLFGALFALYIIWGSTYFVIRIGVESWPPLMMAGVRFLSAGILLMALFGSIIAINAYMYLIRNVNPALATSYAYVNPVVAVLLGTGLGGERLSPVEWAALGVIVFAVVLVTLGKYLFPAGAAVVTPCKTEDSRQ
ncbi:EamA family transporter [Salmonella enterica]|nr:EamA family transporter [Salmonella enterica]